MQLPNAPDAITETKVRDTLTGSLLDPLTLENPAVEAPTIFSAPSKLRIPTQPYRITQV